MRVCAEPFGVAQNVGTGFEIRTPMQIAIDSVQSVVRTLTTSMQAVTMATTSENLFSRACSI